MGIYWRLELNFGGGVGNIPLFGKNHQKKHFTNANLKQRHIKMLEEELGAIK